MRASPLLYFTFDVLRYVAREGGGGRILPTMNDGQAHTIAREEASLLPVTTNPLRKLHHAIQAAWDPLLPDMDFNSLGERFPDS